MSDTDIDIREFRCLTEGTWYRTDVPGGDPCPVDADEIVEACTAGEPPAPHRSVPGDAVDDLAPRLSPAWAVVGLLRDGALVVGGADGTEHRLDASDVRLLRELTVDELDADDRMRAARLCRLGLLRTSSDEPAGADDVVGDDGRGSEAAPPASSDSPDVDAPPPDVRFVEHMSSWDRALNRVGEVVYGARRLERLRNAIGMTERPAFLHRVVRTEETLETLEDHRSEPGEPSDAAAAPDRVPVYAIWHPEVGPLLALGMLTAAARVWDGGSLNDDYEIRRPETAEDFFEDLPRRRGRAILLCSDYVWSLEENLATARRAKAMHPDLVVVHGGPSCPKYDGDAARFLDEHGDVADVLVTGEGEEAIGELLDALRAMPDVLDTDRLAEIDGLTYRSARSGEMVRTASRDRIRELDALPSPYLTGEFDHIPPEAWNNCLSIETNRGCPYGCTFCDWGSSTMSRIRKFDLDRVRREIAWAADHGVVSMMITDANFGIMSRDVEVARDLADSRRRTGRPEWVAVTPAKNTTKHLTEIMDTMLDAAIVPTMSISLQTVDQPTLDAIDRSNITVDHYVRLAAEYRRRGLPLQGDVLAGMAAQTYESYRADLQFNLDHEILVRTWPVQVLPNAPMNDPDYRRRYEIEVDERMVVMSTSTLTRAERERMYLLRRVFVTFEVFGLLRHVLRWLQWDHGLTATDVMDRVIDVTAADPLRYPALSWVVSYFDLFPTAPVSWPRFYDDIRRFLVDELGVEVDSGGEAVFAVQEALMPVPGRVLPAVVGLAHDYPAYYRDATRCLFETGHAEPFEGALRDYPPVDFTVDGDPLELCRLGPQLAGDSRDEVLQGDFYMASTTAYELDSDLVRLLPHVVRMLSDDRVRELVELATEGAALEDLALVPASRVVTLSASSAASS